VSLLRWRISRRPRIGIRYKVSHCSKDEDWSIERSSVNVGPQANNNDDHQAKFVVGCVSWFTVGANSDRHLTEG